MILRSLPGCNHGVPYAQRCSVAANELFPGTLDLPVVHLASRFEERLLQPFLSIERFGWERRVLTSASVQSCGPHLIADRGKIPHDCRWAVGGMIVKRGA